MDHRHMTLDEKLLVANLLERLRDARQAAFAAARSMPEMRTAFDAAETLYSETVDLVGGTYFPVYDREADIESRLARGDRDFTALYGPKP